MVVKIYRHWWSVAAIFGMLLLLNISGCIPQPQPSREEAVHSAEVLFAPASLQHDSLYDQVRAGQLITVRIIQPEANSLDSLVLSLDGTYLQRMDTDTVRINTKDWPMGRHSLRLTSWYQGRNRMDAQTVTVYAPSAPERYSYRKLREFPHDTQAFTQGLLWNNGYLYESTGQRGQSTLRQVDLRTGKVVKSTSLAPSIFGEGLALHQGKFYQLSWTSRVGFIYDTATFEQKGTFQFSQQGWGLTSDGDWLYMTDGTEKVYQVSAKGFQVVRTIQVYDDKGKQVYLNELEIIDGLLYANIFLSDEIVVIDLQSGRLLRRIDMRGLLPMSLYDDRTDILNGIAHDAQNGRTYVTGKYWPKLYQVEFVRL